MADGNPINAALALEQTDPASRSSNLRAMMEGLRRQRALAVLGTLTGDPVLSAVGRQLGDSATAVEGRAARADLAQRKQAADQDAEASRRQWQEGRDARSHAAAMERARVMAGYVNDRQAGERRRKTWIGEDFEDTGSDREVSAPVLSDAQKQIVDARRVLSSVDRVNAMLDKNPNGVLVGDDAVKLSTLVEGLKMRQKEIFNLGVLTGKDYELVSRVVADPTSMKEAIASGAGIRPLRTAFQALAELTKNDASQLAGSLGFRPVPGSPFAPKASTVRVRWKGKVKAIPEARLGEALAAGAERVD